MRALRTQVRVRGVRAAAGRTAVPRLPPARDGYDEDLRLMGKLHNAVCGNGYRSWDTKLVLSTYCQDSAEERAHRECECSIELVTRAAQLFQKG